MMGVCNLHFITAMLFCLWLDNGAVGKPTTHTVNKPSDMVTAGTPWPSGMSAKSEDVHLGTESNVDFNGQSGEGEGHKESTLKDSNYITDVAQERRAPLEVLGPETFIDAESDNKGEENTQQGSNDPYIANRRTDLQILHNTKESTVRVSLEGNHDPIFEDPGDKKGDIFTLDRDHSLEGNKLRGYSEDRNNIHTLEQNTHVDNDVDDDAFWYGYDYDDVDYDDPIDYYYYDGDLHRVPGIDDSTTPDTRSTSRDSNATTQPSDQNKAKPTTRTIAYIPDGDKDPVTEVSSTKNKEQIEELMPEDQREIVERKRNLFEETTFAPHEEDENTDDTHNFHLDEQFQSESSTQLNSGTVETDSANDGSLHHANTGDVSAHNDGDLPGADYTEPLTDFSEHNGDDHVHAHDNTGHGGSEIEHGAQRDFHLNLDNTEHQIHFNADEYGAENHHLDANTHRIDEGEHESQDPDLRGGPYQENVDAVDVHDRNLNRFANDHNIDDLEDSNGTLDHQVDHGIPSVVDPANTDNSDIQEGDVELPKPQDPTLPINSTAVEAHNDTESHDNEPRSDVELINPTHSYSDTLSSHSVLAYTQSVLRSSISSSPSSRGVTHELRESYFVQTSTHVLVNEPALSSTLMEVSTNHIGTTTLYEPSPTISSSMDFDAITVSETRSISPTSATVSLEQSQIPAFVNSEVHFHGILQSEDISVSSVAWEIDESSHNIMYSQSLSGPSLSFTNRAHGVTESAVTNSVVTTKTTVKTNGTASEVESGSHEEGEVVEESEATMSDHSPQMSHADTPSFRDSTTSTSTISIITTHSTPQHNLGVNPVVPHMQTNSNEDRETNPTGHPPVVDVHSPSVPNYITSETQPSTASSPSPPQSSLTSSSTLATRENTTAEVSSSPDTDRAPQLATQNTLHSPSTMKIPVSPANVDHETYPQSSSTPPSTLPTTLGIDTENTKVSEAQTSAENVRPRPFMPAETSETPSSFVELKLDMSWPDFCTNEGSIRGELITILRVQGGRGEVTADQIQLLNVRREACFGLNVENEEILVQIFLTNKSHHYDQGLTLVCARILESGPQLSQSSIIGRKLIGVRFHEEHNIKPSTGTSPRSAEGEEDPSDEDPNPFSDPGVTIAVTLAVVGGCCCAGIIVIQITVRQRHRKNQMPAPGMNRSFSMNSTDSMQLSSVTKSRPNSGIFNLGLDLVDPPDSCHPLNVTQLANFCMQEKNIFNEYQKLPNKLPRLSVVPDGEEDKNRYANILPLAHTRVKLLQDGTEPRSSYINANYVTGPGKQCQYYIATQAPTQSTVIDFWTMVWQQGSQAIIMLTQMDEEGQTKCAPYWPEMAGKSAAQKYGDFLIQLKHKDVNQEYIASKLEINHLRKIEKRQIDHYWYTCWPSRGLPEPISLVKLVLDTRLSYESSKAPVIVHCSPGTGRTCAFIALDLCMRQFESQRHVDVMQTVHAIRQERAGAIQNKEQYAMLYHAINEYATIVVSPVMSAASSATTLHALLPG